jgi:hypothetical protein
MFPSNVTHEDCLDLGSFSVRAKDMNIILNLDDAVVETKLLDDEVIKSIFRFEPQYAADGTLRIRVNNENPSSPIGKLAAKVVTVVVFETPPLWFEMTK